MTTGEPWNPEPYRWLFENVGGSRVPIINCSGGTEVGACFLSPTPIGPIKACSLGGPALGMAMDVVDDAGSSLLGTGEVGELVCRKPFPGMTRGFWRDPDKYLETYWSRIPGVWVHGDWASVDEDGFWFLHGRSDDTMNIAGKRIGPAELESAAVGHPAVREAAAIGVPHEVKGETAWIFCCLLPGARGDARPTSPTTSRPSSARRSSPTASSSSTRCRRRAPRRSCAARSRRPRSAPTPATSRRSRTPSHSTRSEQQLAEGIALVTGGGRGIGANIARSLAADGWSVVVTARSRDQIDAVAAEIGGRAIEMDVAVAGVGRARLRTRSGRSTCSSRTPASGTTRPTGGARSR